MRPEVWQVVTRTGSVVLVTGDTGTGKSSVLQSTLAEYSSNVVAPRVSVCLFDSGALQSGLLDSLAESLAIAQPGQARWRDLATRLRNATREAAIEVGRALADAVVEEVVELAKAKLGENAGKGLLKFWKTLNKNAGLDLRRSLRTQADVNVVRLLIRLGNEVASVVGRDIVISLDECNRLSDDDQRVLASIAAQPAGRLRIVAAWSTAEVESLPGLERLRKLGVAEVPVSGLTDDEVRRWLETAGLAKHADDVYALTAGYPLLVEGLVAHLRSGGQIERYSAPTLFNDILRDALARLPADAQYAARRLCAFTYPPSEVSIPAYLGVDVVMWGVIRAALERERVFSVGYPEGEWFHEARRLYLWDVVLTEPERSLIGQGAYSELVDAQCRDDAVHSSGLYRQLSVLAPYAQESLANNANLRAVVDMDADHLAVLAAAIELENADSASATPAEQVVIHAHTAFGADRGAAIEVLPSLEQSGVIQLTDEPGSGSEQVNTTLRLLLNPESTMVAQGLIQSVLRKSAVPQLTDHVVRAHLERVRLASYLVITQTGESDALDVIASADLGRAPAFLRPVGDPVLGVWLRYGDQPVTVVGIFNSKGDRAAAEREIKNLSGSSFGRRVTVDRTLQDPTHTIASLRFLRAVSFATGLSVYSNHHDYWLDHSPGLPMLEFAQRQVDLLELLRSETDELERAVYDLVRPCGIAIARKGKAEYSLDVRGAAHVYPMDFDQTSSILAQGSLVSARMELALDLPPSVTTKHLITNSWLEERVQDPVVEMLNRLRKQAAKFNARQPRHAVHLEAHRLRDELARAHVRDQRLAHAMSETITIGGERGSRPSRALRLAIHTHGPPNRPLRRVALCAWPPGDPEDVQVRYVADMAVDSADAAYRAAFGGDADATDLHGAMLPEMLASLLGFETRDIELIA